MIIDGTVVNIGDKILIMNHSNPSTNGVYKVAGVTVQNFIQDLLEGLSIESATWRVGSSIRLYDEAEVKKIQDIIAFFKSKRRRRYTTMSEKNQTAFRLRFC